MEFFVEIPDSDKRVEVGIVFLKDKAFIQSIGRDGNLHHFSRTNQNRIARFPIGEPAVIVAKKYEGLSVFFGHKEIVYGDNEIEELELKETTEADVETIIRALF